MDSLFRNFYVHVKTTPLKIALSENNENISFQELNARTDYVAANLVKQGAITGDTVGYQGPTGIPFVVAGLACLKVGVAFLPISQKFPHKSVCDVLSVAKARLFFTESVATNESFGTPKISLPDDTEASEPFMPETIAPSTGAFVFHTSGSTGLPKIVTYRRDAFKEFSRCLQELAGPASDLVIGHAGTMWLDFIFGFLSNGSKVVCHDVTAEGPQSLFDWLEKERINFWFCFPALFRTMANVRGDALKDLKNTFLIGESLFQDDVDLFTQLTLPGAELISSYGQSEFTLATAHFLAHGEQLTTKMAPVGKSVVENDLKILSADGSVVKLGAIGEIVHRSWLVPEGYTNNPEKTLQSFVTGKDGLRSFYTGDLGYISADGNLHYVGRKDDQIKIRGFNVLPSEIEKEIKLHPDVDEVIVGATHCERGIVRLACHYEGSASPENLKLWLLNRIPVYMIPQFLVSTKILPRTHSGKLKRNSLTIPKNMLGTQVLVAQTSEEKELVRIWASVLGHDNFGVADNFFDIGGDSLRSMEMLLSLSQKGGYIVGMDEFILAGSTIKSILTLQEPGRTNNLQRVLRPSPGNHHLAAIHTADGQVSSYLEFAQKLDSSIAVTGICADYSRRSRAIPITQKAHEAMANLPKSGSPILMGFSYGGSVAFETARIAKNVNRLILVDPFGWLKKRERMVEKVKRTLAPKRKSGRERLHPDDSKFAPSPLKIDKVLFITCDDTSKRALDGWKTALDGHVDYFYVPGRHRDMLQGANAIEISCKVRLWLDE